MRNLMAPETHNWLNGVKHMGNVQKNPAITALKMHPWTSRFWSIPELQGACFLRYSLPCPHHRGIYRSHSHSSTHS